MSETNPQVRLGVIGAAGSMATNHRNYYESIPALKLAAISDISQDLLDPISESTGAKAYTDAEAMIASGDIDAVFIACPHYDHPRYSEFAFEHGVHVMTEKPVAVTALAAEQTNAAYAEALKKHPNLLYAAMFNQRTRPLWKEVKRLCSDGSIGELMRVSWTITSWFRTQAYYDSGGWRATWAGEGGGVLLNQCPHNLDLLCWFVGSPASVNAQVSLGKYHNIEVEDDVTALLTFANGATGTFMTSTGQTPGINRLEIVGTGGTLLCENDQLTYLRADESVDSFTKTCTERFADVPCTKFQITPPPQNTPDHQPVTENFIETIAKGGTQADLIAPATEGIAGLELGNAMLMAGLTQQTVNIPTDRAAYDALLEDLKAKSTYQKPEVVNTGPVDMAASSA
ncbi:MAG: Gfo/Idh/MocA family oxidoreductase [Planctomycetota bacterium]